MHSWQYIKISILSLVDTIFKIGNGNGRNGEIQMEMHRPQHKQADILQISLKTNKRLFPSFSQNLIN